MEKLVVEGRQHNVALSLVVFHAKKVSTFLEVILRAFLVFFRSMLFVGVLALMPVNSSVLELSRFLHFSNNRLFWVFALCLNSVELWQVLF